MKQVRRDFLKNIAIITAGSLMLPKILRANTTSTITVHAPELEGEKYTGSLVQIYDAGTNVLLGQSTTVNSEATITFTTGVKEQNDTAWLLSKLDATDNGGNIVVSYPVHKESKVSIGIYDVLGRRVEERTVIQTKGNHQYQFNTKNLASGHYFFRVQTPEYLGTMDLPIMERQLAVPKGFSPQSSVVSLESKKKIDRLDKISSGDYKIVISNPTGHYTRTFIIPAPANKQVNDKVVGFVQQSGVTPELFRAFCQEVNFDSADNLPYEGFKTFFPKKNTTGILIWIACDDRLDQYGKPRYPQTAAEQEYMKNLFINQVFPSITQKYQPTFYVVDPQHREDYPTNNHDGMIIIMPTILDIYNSVVNDFTGDGILDTAGLQMGGGYAPAGFSSTWATPDFNPKKIRALSQALCAPKQATSTQYNNLTVLSANAQAAQLTTMDKKLIKIAEYYKPKSAIGEILGI
ncbi:MAG: T9SS type A sorting domain-containing protein [Bacteroidetes bacterium]|nr:T9SS type A sorting domain-containing protein [Bacteroidota bacterium]